MTQKSDAQNSEFDSMQDVDLSGIEIIDTSTGGNIEIEGAKIFNIKCLKCGFVYEGTTQIDTCPRCGSKDLDDSQTNS